MNDHLISHFAVKLGIYLRSKMLPTQVTAAELNEVFGDDSTAVQSKIFDILARLTEVTGIWAETIKCPELGNEPAMDYHTFYRAEQKSLLDQARAPAAGPYFIPDSVRS